MRDETEIQDEFDEAVAATIERNNKYPAMSYEQGVRDGLAWVLEEQDEAPISGDV
jgi:hypothetical protein